MKYNTDNQKKKEEKEDKDNPILNQWVGHI